jgi:hypothetical protein
MRGSFAGDPGRWRWITRSPVNLDHLFFFCFFYFARWKVFNWSRTMWTAASQSDLITISNGPWLVLRRGLNAGSCVQTGKKGRKTRTRAPPKNRSLITKTTTNISLFLQHAFALRERPPGTLRKKQKKYYWISWDRRRDIYGDISHRSPSESNAHWQRSKYSLGIINGHITSALLGEICQDYSRGYCCTHTTPIHVIIRICPFSLVSCAFGSPVFFFWRSTATLQFFYENVHFFIGFCLPVHKRPREPIIAHAIYGGY